MRLAAEVFHRDARECFEMHAAHRDILDALEAPHIQIGPGASAIVRAHIGGRLRKAGWASPARVAVGFDLELAFLHDRILVQIQTGNVTRMFYDLMKMQAVHEQGRADCGALIVPTAQAARKMGSNLAQFERLEKELRGVFFRQITIPIAAVGFE